MVRWRVLVVDDDPHAREALRAFLDRQEAFRFAGEAPDGQRAIAAYADVRPDLVLMDLQMPGRSGIDATREICRRWPDACVLVLTSFSTQDFVVPALRAGAAGYLLKDAGGPALLSAMQHALDGEMPLSGLVRRQVVAELRSGGEDAASDAADVTPRELELLSLLARGLSNAAIAGEMFVSEGTVKQYLSHVSAKLGVRTRTQVIVRVIQLGLVDPHALPPVGASA